MNFLYPRLPGPVANSLCAELEELPISDLRDRASTSHRAAAPAPTGGQPVSEAQLERVAKAVRDALGSRLASPLPRMEVAEADALIGEALHREMKISPADAAHDGVWAFLSLVILPDVASWRFSGRAKARMLGGPRNVFRRTWWRQQVLGDLLTDPGSHGDRPLAEDELVGIFERSRMSRSHVLARRIAVHLLESKAKNRTAYARELIKRIRRVLAYRTVDLLTPGEVDVLIGGISDTVLGGA